MIKIRLFEPDIHRNETTFRPYRFIENELRQLGIQLVTDASSYDFMLIGQASIADKKLPLKESVDMGLKKLSKITGDYIIVDGQDAPTLIGTIDIFRHVYKNSNCKLFLKTSYYKDFDDYKQGWVLGRKYWGKGDYKVPDIDDMKPKMKLAGFNWLSTIVPNWNIPSNHFNRTHDIWAFFQYPMGKEVYEHGQLQSIHYDNFRKGLHDILIDLETKKFDTGYQKYNIIRMKDGNRISLDDYYKQMYNSKIIVAAFGYGEIAPRDIESAMFHSVLFKNDMSHIQTIPNPYIPFETYIPIKWDWSDFEEKIQSFLQKDASGVEHAVYEAEDYAERLKEKYIEENDPMKRVLHLYNLLKNLDGVETEGE